MTIVKVRSPDGSELAFHTNEEFCDAVGMGSITAAWEIFHERRGHWLPIAVHPAFQALTGRLWDESGPEPLPAAV